MCYLFVVQNYWQRADGQTVPRDQLMMVLANLDRILIKATYTGDTREVALKDVYMDVADDRLLGGRPERAYEVEACNCPRGFSGLSCQVLLHVHDVDVDVDEYVVLVYLT